MTESRSSLTPRDAPMDVCECGDYRRQHDKRGCVICRWHLRQCDRFRLFQRALEPLADMHRLTKHLTGGKS